jgi:Na+-transporting NADH:ubiquinone oxidoreductase subunit E
MEHYLDIFVRSAFVENMALAYFLGMCSFIAVSRRVDTAVGLAGAVLFVLALTAPLNAAIYHHLLRKGALAWVDPSFADVDLTFLSFLTFIGTIAAAVQVVEMAVDRYSPRLHAALGIFLPLIAVNCAILGASLFIAQREYSVEEAAVFGLGAGVGWGLAVIAMAAIRERLRYSDVPPGLRGLGITFMIAGLMAMAFMAFAGVQL